MSLLNALYGIFTPDDAGLKESISSAKESLARLEILTNELNVKESAKRSYDVLMSVAMDSMEDPMWGKDVNGMFVFLNEACAKKILNTTVDKCLAMTDDDFKNNALSMVCMKSDQIVMDTGKTHRQIEYAVYDDGRFLCLDTTKSVWVVNGDLVGTVGFGKDISGLIPDSYRKRIHGCGRIPLGVGKLYCVKDVIDLLNEHMGGEK